MTDNPFEPLLRMDDSVAESPEWRGGSLDSIVIDQDITQDRLKSLCQHAYNNGFRYAEIDNSIFLDSRSLLCFIKPD